MLIRANIRTRPISLACVAPRHIRHVWPTSKAVNCRASHSCIPWRVTLLFTTSCQPSPTAKYNQICGSVTLLMYTLFLYNSYTYVRTHALTHVRAYTNTHRHTRTHTHTHTHTHTNIHTQTYIYSSNMHLRQIFHSEHNTLVIVR